jgi:putative acetyltransferase
MLEFKPNNISDEQVSELIQKHLNFVSEAAPNIHYELPDIKRLKQDHYKLWTAWQGEEAIAFFVLKVLSAEHCELFYLHVKESCRGRGIGEKVLSRAMDEAQDMGFIRMSLEYGLGEHYSASRGVIEKFGFKFCGPFGDHFMNPLRVYMTRKI